MGWAVGRWGDGCFRRRNGELRSVIHCMFCVRWFILLALVNVFAYAGR